MAPNERSLQVVIEDIKFEPQKSKTAVAKDYVVNRRMLARRLAGETESHAVAYEEVQKLSRSEENFVVLWIIAEDRQGTAPGVKQVVAMAEHIARLKGDLTSCGKNWLKKFKKRNPTIQVAIERRIDAKRVNQAADKEVISAFFELCSEDQ